MQRENFFLYRTCKAAHVIYLLDSCLIIMRTADIFLSIYFNKNSHSKLIAFFTEKWWVVAKMIIVAKGGEFMEAGVRNNISGEVEEIKTDNVMAQVVM